MTTERGVTAKTSPDRLQALHTTAVFDDDYLSDEVLFMIFIHLPTKAVYRYRCVSKRWLSLLSDSKLASIFFSNPIRRPFSTLSVNIENRKKLWKVHHIGDSESNLDHTFNLDFIPNSCQAVVVVASYNDLILLHPSTVGQACAYLCNIFTKQWIQIPLPCCLHGDLHVNVMGLLPDRVVCLHTECIRAHGHAFKALVFKFSNGKWREEVTPLGLLSIHPSRCPKALACNGKLYWLTNLKKRGFVLEYDPSKNGSEFGEIEYPLDTTDDENDHINSMTSWSIGSCQGKLRLSKVLRHKLSHRMLFPDELVLWIWELEDDRKISNSWCLERKESLLDFVFEDDCTSLRKKHKCFHPGLNPPPVVGFHPYDRDIIYLDFRDKFILCDLRQRTSRYNSTSSHLEGGNLTVHHPWCPTPLPRVRLPQADKPAMHS